MRKGTRLTFNTLSFVVVAPFGQYSEEVPPEGECEEVVTTTCLSFGVYHAVRPVTG